MVGCRDIDIEALRKKYSRPRTELQQEAAAQTSNSSSMESKITDIKMCQACQAHGTVKKQYGYRVLEEVCDQCNGEGCFVPGKDKKASLDLKMKVQQVERLVEECEDLDELEKYEDALRKRTPAALDAVLKAARMAAIDAIDAAEASAAAAPAADASAELS